MRHRKNKFVLDRNASSRKALLRSLANAVILFERIKTTDARAKAVRPMVERAITLGKDPTLAHRRLLMQRLGRRSTVAKVIEMLSPQYRERKGGYTRIIRVGRRRGDAAEIVQLEFVHVADVAKVSKATS